MAAAAEHEPGGGEALDSRQGLKRQRNRNKGETWREVTGRRGGTKGLLGSEYLSEDCPGRAPSQKPLQTFHTLYATHAILCHKSAVNEAPV